MYLGRSEDALGTPIQSFQVLVVRRMNVSSGIWTALQETRFRPALDETRGYLNNRSRAAGGSITSEIMQSNTRNKHLTSLVSSQQVRLDTDRSRLGVSIALWTEASRVQAERCKRRDSKHNLHAQHGLDGIEIMRNGWLNFS